jgi:hypothetical protein
MAESEEEVRRLWEDLLAKIDLRKLLEESILKEALNDAYSNAFVPIAGSGRIEWEITRVYKLNQIECTILIEPEESDERKD